MNSEFLNVNPPNQFSEWVVENLNRCFNRENMTGACEKNIKDFPEDKELFQNLIIEMFMYSHSKVFNYYQEQLKKEIN
jgi:hypothetical protein